MTTQDLSELLRTFQCHSEPLRTPHNLQGPARLLRTIQDNSGVFWTTQELSELLRITAQDFSGPLRTCKA